jgi:hypothetical protein
MRKYLFMALFLGFAAQLMGQTVEKQPDGAIISFEKKSHDFGDITQGDKVEFTYHFTNAGNEPLIITNVQVTCGCTVPKGWPRDPIPPGGSGELTVSFNSAGKIGKQNKTVTVVSNAVNAEGNLVNFSTNILEKVSKPQ